VRPRERIEVLSLVRDCQDVALGLHGRASGQRGELATLLAELAAVCVGLGRAVEKLAMDK
jgi:hypothetical protein